MTRFDQRAAAGARRWSQSDPSGRADDLDFSGSLRELADGGADQRNGPAHWEAGKTYRESLDYEIPSWATGPLSVEVGIFHAHAPNEKGLQYLRVVSGPSDGKNTVVVGKIGVD